MGTKTAVACVVCGADVTAKDPVRYPYCKACHYTGVASEHLRADQLGRFRDAFPDAKVAIEHTGGGCFWLAFYFGEISYIATDGEASLPQDENGDPILDGWGLVSRQRVDDEDWENAVMILDAFGDDADHYWETYPANAKSDTELINAIREDRA